jgi:hypothetical protein
VCPEEIAQAHEGSNRLDIGGWFGVLDGFEFIFAQFNPIWSKSETQVRDFLVSEYAFLQVDFEVIFV